MRDASLTYQPGLQVSSFVGKFKVRLGDTVTGPPVKGTNTWTFEVDDASALRSMGSESR
jgi:hypothetical protein